MKVGVVGGSGYVGGELIRLLLGHPHVELSIATSRQYKDEYIHRVHPNLRGATQLQFSDHDIGKVTGSCDLVFTSVPHGTSVRIIPELVTAGVGIIDMAADFRFRDPKDYPIWYGYEHPHPHLLEKFVYGLPELHREELRGAKMISVPGCMALTSTLAIAPLVKNGAIELTRIVVDSKIGSSGGGMKPTVATHHSERYGVIRPYKPVGHRHTGEIEQELSRLAGTKVKVSMSPHAVNMVRGILCTSHVFRTKPLGAADIWKMYRSFYQNEPFIRLVRDRKGVYRYPDPKVLIGSNFIDIGFEPDEHSERIVLLSATDNLMKGAAGTAVQAMNVAQGFDERAGLQSLGLHPV